MIRLARYLATLTAAAILVVSSSLAGAPLKAAAAAPVVQTALAQILVDQHGLTLYAFAADKKNQSFCNGPCATAWPPLLVPTGATVPSTMPGIAGTFATATRADGTHQLTFDGAPLYTWFKDKRQGDITGQGIANTWWAVVAPTVAISSTATTTTSTTPTPAAATAGAKALVKTAPAQVLVNQNGMTLYVFAPDKKNQSTCTGECATFWPPLELASAAPAPSSLPGIAGEFSTGLRADGSRQVTFDGAPLYTWSKDKAPGDMTGQGIGGVWWVAVAPLSLPVVAISSLQLLTDQRGMTLYVFAQDKKNQSTCYSQCALAWPPVLVPSGLTVPATLPGVAGTFGVAPRTDGTRQLTYDGAPLYTWFRDKKPGDVTGQGIAGTWWAVFAPTAAANTAP